MIYLNNAATSYPKPARVVERVCSYVSSIPYHASRANSDFASADLLDTCRNKLAQLFGVSDSSRIVLTSGATEALNLVFRGLELAGSHIISSVTEHNSVLRPLRHLERDGVIELSLVACDSAGRIDPGDIQRAIRPNTRLVVINHGSNVTGVVQDLAAIAQVAHDHGLMCVVDAAQTAGNLPLDVSKLPIDAMVFAGHKYLFGLQGTGGVYLRPGLELRPLKVGGTGVRSESVFQPEEGPLLYEAGTPNVPGIVSMTAGVEFLLAEGVENLRNRALRRFEELRRALGEIEGVTMYGEARSNAQLAVLSFNIDGWNPDQVSYALENSFDIVVRSGLHCAPLMHEAIGTSLEGTVRASPSCHTTEQEVMNLVVAIQQMAKAR